MQGNLGNRGAPILGFVGILERIDVRVAPGAGGPLAYQNVTFFVRPVSREKSVPQNGLASSKIGTKIALEILVVVLL